MYNLGNKNFYEFNVELWVEEIKYKFWLHLHRSRYTLPVTEDLMQVFCSQNVSQSSLSQESEQNISIKKQERNPNFVQLVQTKKNYDNLYIIPLHQ